MTAREPYRIWWSAEELAQAGLPDLPATKRRVNALAERNQWRGDTTHARRRPGRGGGWEYHWSLLPLSAQRKLLAETADPVESMSLDRVDAWAAFEALPDKDKAEAQVRLKVLAEAEALEAAGMSRDGAMKEVAKIHGKSCRTIWRWRSFIANVEAEDRLAYLVPSYRAPDKYVAPIEDCHPEFWAMLVSDYLRPAGPTFAQCWRAAKAYAQMKGYAYLTERTADRRLKREIPRITRVFKREGLAGLERYYAPQIRDRSGLHALEVVVADCHKIDVFVQWPSGMINRPQIVGFQDVYSGKILSWRVDHDPNKVAVMAAFGDVVEEYGIPKTCYFDNGREFANKWMTGGSPTRFRFKITDDEPLGVLPLLGIKVLWAKPAHGQSKPIERTFRDLASDVSKDPRFDGAYVGHKPDAKPADYGSHAVPVEEFLRVLDEGIAEHNARPGRRSHTANGRSFDDTFAQSYARSPIRKATEEQRRLWLMGQETRKLDRNNGRLKLQGNYYAADWLGEHAGAEVVARFDPEDLHSGLWLYEKTGAFMGFVPCQQKTGFMDMVEAKADAKRKGQMRRLERKLAKLRTPLSASDVGARKDEVAQTRPSSPSLDAKVVSPNFGASVKRISPPAPASPAPDRAVEARREAMILSIEPAQEVEAVQEEPRDRFRRALEIAARLEAGTAVGSEEARWLTSYQLSAEYRAQSRMYEQFGEDALDE